MEFVRGRYRYRLAHDVGGGVNVLGEVATVAALERLLAAYSRLTLADFAEDPGAD